TGDVVLYDLAVRNRDTGAWQPYCLPDPNGLRAAIVLPGEHGFQITCTAGAIGKCVRFGYHPWKVAADGRSMREYHAACVRLVRADYCGDGTPHTENGTLIDVYDPVGVQQPDNGPGMAFEAAWSPSGAVCVARTRKPHLLSLDQLRQRCPQVRIADSCDA